MTTNSSKDLQRAMEFARQVWLQTKDEIDYQIYLRLALAKELCDNASHNEATQKPFDSIQSERMRD